MTHSDPASQRMASLDFDGPRKESIRRFSIEKLKFFSRRGEVVYSTTAADVGVVNDQAYVHDIVANGAIFSKVVVKGTQTMEGRTIHRDLAEIYVPVMENQTFIGALEIYYDITIPTLTLDRLLKRTTVVSIGAAMFLLWVVTTTLLKASGADLNRLDAEAGLHRSHDRLAESVEEKTRETKITQKTSIEALAILAESYDPDTGIQRERIQQYVAVLIEHLQHHPNRTFFEHFAKDSYLALARDIALYHHEKWDGSGYPDGLRGEAIPLSARIVAVADVYDALRSERPYKRAWSHRQAFDEILSQSGIHFDPDVVAAFAANARTFERISSR